MPSKEPYCSAAPNTASPSQHSIGGGGESNSTGIQSMTPPESWRKSKGYIKSACVPCKRAHLRCNVQRPCSGCIKRGAHDSCIDTKHKKRGRHRPQNDADIQFGPLSPSLTRNVSPGRPWGICSPGGFKPLLLDDSYQTHQPFRRSEISAGNSCLAKLDERASLSNQKCHNVPIPSTPNSPEPVAHLTMDLGFIKASAAFWDATGLSNMTGRNLRDVVLPTEIEKVTQIQCYFNSAQKKREPNNISPILGRGAHNVQELGFPVEGLRIPLKFHYLAFMGANGYARPAATRAYLAKEGPFYFIVLVLDVALRQLQTSYPPRAPSPQTGAPHKRPRLEKVFARRACFDFIRNHISESRRPANLVPNHDRRPASYIEHDSKYTGRLYGASMGRQPYGGHLHPATQQASADQSAPRLRQGSRPAPIQCQSEQTPHSGARSGRVDIRALLNI